MREIELSMGQKVKVDDADYEELSQYKWCYSNGYAARRNRASSNKTTVNIYMHRQICGLEAGSCVFHKDGDKLNNQRSNLLVLTRTNLIQKNAPRAVSGFKGVHFALGKWVAQISVNGKNKHLGRFIDKVEAAQRYDAEARKLHGEHAFLNFGPDSPHYVAPQTECADAV